LHDGITAPIDGRKFPESMNAAFGAHGYDTVQIDGKDLVPIHGCPNSWAGDLDLETQQLVKKVYAKDFELICKHFGYCTDSELTCTKGVPGMCPPKALAALRAKEFWSKLAK